MISAWSCVRLGDVLRPTTHEEPVDRSATYRLLGVRLDGEGPFLREEKAGTTISATRLARVRAGDFIYSRLFAWRGAFGVIPPELGGCHVSGEFPTFAAVPERLDLHFLKYWFRLPGTLRAVEAWCSGSTPLTRNRLKEERFLALEVPLPPLAEQRGVVAQVEELAAKLDGARQFRLSAHVEASGLPQAFSALFFSLQSRHDLAPLETLCSTVIDCPHSNPAYSDDGVPTLRSPDVGWGSVDLVGAKKTSEAEYARRTQRGAPQVDDVVVVREGGGTGKAGIVLAGQRFSLGQRVMLLRPRMDRLLPRFLLHQWLSALIQEGHILPLTKGSASPHLNISAIRRFPFVVPPILEQRRIVAYLDDLQAKVDALKALQEKTAAELDALMPSILDKAFRGEL